MRDPEGVFDAVPHRLESALDSMEDMLYVFDTAQRLVAWNARFADVSGYAATELHGMSPTEFVRDQDVDALRRYLEEVGETGSGTVRAELRTKGGETIPYEFYSTAFQTAEGTVLGRIGVGRDVTERAELDRRLRRENERLDEFASVLSHDLRNPLAVARGHLEVLADELEGESRNLAKVDEGLDRIERIIGDVLELARTGELVATPSSVSLAATSRDVWADVERGRTDLTVEDDPEFTADESLLQRMFTNLFRNAIEHAGEEVHVRVGSLADAEGFYVADDGPGIDPSNRGHVFDWRFTTKDTGFGVGLQSVREVCDAHGWSIAATESREGGARFEVTGVE